MGPLKGIRVLEFAQIIAGPTCCQHLADMGAEIIKVEPPGGETFRHMGSIVPTESKSFQALNRGKKSIVLKLGEPESRKIVAQLVAGADVAVVGNRPDVSARLGIDYESFRAIKPDIIYADITAFGRKGPWASRPGYDVVAQAVSGLMAAEGKYDEYGAPRHLNSPFADFGTGLVTAWAICAALFHRQRTGEGQMVQTNLLATALTLQCLSVMDLPAVDQMTRVPMLERIAELRRQRAPYPDLVKEHQSGRKMPGDIFYRVFQTSDGALATGAVSNALRSKMRTALAVDWLYVDDPGYNPLDPETQRRGEEITRQVEDQFRGRPTAEWIALFDQAGVPAGALKFPEELVDEEQVIANNMVVKLEHPVTGASRQVAPPVKMTGTPLEVLSASPTLGRDTDDVLGGIGYTESQISDLKTRGIAG